MPEHINEVIKHLTPKTEKEIQAYFDAHPKEAFNDTIENEDVDRFKEYIKNNIITRGNIKKIFMSLWIIDNLGSGPSWSTKKNKICEYIVANYDEIKKYLPAHKDVINAQESTHEKRNYPKGYKQWRVLKLIAKHHKGIRRTEIIKFIYELGWGPGSYNPIENYSYWSANLPRTIFDYCYQNPVFKKYTIAPQGKEKIKQLDKRFKNVDIDAYL